MKDTMRRLLAAMLCLMLLLGNLLIGTLAESFERTAGDVVLKSEVNTSDSTAAPVRDTSNAVTVAGDVAPAAAKTLVSLELTASNTSKYSATGFGNQSAIPEIIFVGDTIYMRFRLRIKQDADIGSTVKIRLRESYKDDSGQVQTKLISPRAIKDTNSTKPAMNPDTWNEEDSSFAYKSKSNNVDIVSFGFTPDASYAGKEVTYELVVLNEDDIEQSYALASGVKKQIKFRVDPADQKYDFELQLYRAIAGGEDKENDPVYSFNSSDQVYYGSGDIVKFRIAVSNLCKNDMTLKLSESTGAPADELNGYEIDWEETDENQARAGEIRYNTETGELFLPAGVIVILKTVNDEYAATSDFTYTVTAQLQKDEKNTEYDFSQSKTINGHVGTSSKMQFGYNLAISSARFDADYDFSSNDPYVIAGTSLLSAGTSAGGGQKFVHEKSYAEGDPVSVINTRPIDTTEGEGKATFLFWYDKRALRQEDKFIEPGDTVYKDNTNPNTIDAIWAVFPTESKVEIRNGEDFTVSMDDITLAGENNEYSKDSVFAQFQDGMQYSFEVTSHTASGSASYESDKYDDYSEFEDDPNWAQNAIGVYEYKIITYVNTRSGISIPVEGYATLTILPRPIVVVVNDEKYPYDGKSKTVAKQETDGKEYVVWTDASKYTANGQLERTGELYAILDEAFYTVTGTNIPEGVEYTSGDVYFARGESWDDDRDDATVITYNNSDSQTYPGKYTANVDFSSYSNVYKLSEGTTDSGRKYQVYVLDSYAYVFFDGELEIAPANLEIKKVLNEDDSFTGGTFTFHVLDEDGEVVNFVKRGEEYVQVPENYDNTLGEPKADITLTLQKGDTEAITTPMLLYANATYSVKEVGVERNEKTVDLAKNYKTTYTSWLCVDEEGQADQAGDGEQPTDSGYIEMDHTATATITNDRPSWKVSKGVEVMTAAVQGEVTVGDTLKYTITVENTGKVDLTLNVNDVFARKVKGTCTNFVWSMAQTGGGTAGSQGNGDTWAKVNEALAQTALPVGQTLTITYEYVIQENDPNPIVNTVDVDDKTYCPTAASREDHNLNTEDDHVASARIAYDGPSFKLTKSVSNMSGSVGADGIQAARVGDILTYTIKVENTGSTTLENLEVTDKSLSPIMDTTEAEGVTYDEDEGVWTIETLAPKGTVEITYTYTVKYTDANGIHNVATVQDPGNPDDPDDPNPDHTATKDTPVELSKLTIEKELVDDEFNDGTITFNFQVWTHPRDGGTPELIYFVNNTEADEDTEGAKSTLSITLDAKKDRDTSTEPATVKASITVYLTPGEYDVLEVDASGNKVLHGGICATADGSYEVSYNDRSGEVTNGWLTVYDNNDDQHDPAYTTITNTAKYYYVAHYVADLNDDGELETNNIFEQELTSYPGYVQLEINGEAFIEKKSLTSGLTAEDVHEAAKKAYPAEGWSIKDQHIASPSASEAIQTGGEDDYKEFVYASGGSDKLSGTKYSSWVWSANDAYLGAKNGDAITAGEIVPVFWDRVLEFTQENDGRNVTADKNVYTRLGRQYSIRQGEITYVTDYKLWRELGKTGSNELGGTDGFVVKDAWQDINGISVHYENTDSKLANSNSKKNFYIFHSAVADALGDESESPAVEITSNDVIVRNTKGNTQTKLNLVPRFLVQYHTRYFDKNGKQTKSESHLSSAFYTVDFDAGEGAVKNPLIGTQYPTILTLESTKSGYSSWKLKDWDGKEAKSLDSLAIMDLFEGGYVETSSSKMATDTANTKRQFPTINLYSEMREPLVSATPTNAPSVTPTPEPPQILVSLTGRKIWEDDNNAAGKRPESIVVRLLRNGTLIQEKRVSAADNWGYIFADLPGIDLATGAWYTYTISEQPVDSYYGRTVNTDLVNTYMPDGTTYVEDPSGYSGGQMSEESLEQGLMLPGYETTQVGPLMNTGDDTPVYPFVFGGIGAVAVIALLVLGRKKKKGQ